MTYDPHDEPEPPPQEYCEICGAQLEIAWLDRIATCPNGCNQEDT